MKSIYVYNDAVREQGKTLLSHSFIAVFLSAVVILKPALYIPALGICISTSILPHIVMISTLLFISSPLRVLCRKNWIAFYFLPVSFWGWVLFAQHHLVVAIILLITVVLVFLVRLNILHQKYSKRPKRRCILAARFLVSALSVIFFIPALISFCCYDTSPPSYTPRQDIWSDALEKERVSDSTENLLEQNLELFSEFRENVWTEKTIQERTDLIQRLTDFECQRFGIPAVPVTVAVMEESVRGRYDPGTNAITINSIFVSDAGASTIMKSVFHECHHSYLSFIVQNTDFENPISNTLLYSEVREWRDNMADYQNATIHGYFAYTDQPIEAAARAWAEQELKAIQECIDAKEIDLKS